MFNDYKSISSSEFEATARLNLVHLWLGDFFMQLGAGWAFYREDEREINTYTMDAVAGYRFFFLNGFYAEPFVRMGYPFEVNMGIMAGHWFSF
jgi:hypothetical protein